MKVCFKFFILFHIIIASADALDDFVVIAASKAFIFFSLFALIAVVIPCPLQAVLLLEMFYEDRRSLTNKIFLRSIFLEPFGMAVMRALMPTSLKQKSGHCTGVTTTPV